MLEKQESAIRRSAALSLMDHVVCLRLSGTNAFEVLDRICPAELHLRDTQMMYTLLLDQAARPLADVFICCDDEDFLILAEGMEATRLRDYFLSQALPAEHIQVDDLSQSHGLLSLNGPYAWEVLAALLGPEVIGLPYLTFFHLGQTTCIRAGKTGEYGYDLLLPREELDKTQARLMELGRPLDLELAGLEALEQCALENWFFNIRREGKADLTPIELQLQWRVSYQKEYVGAKALAERRRTGPGQRLTCLTAADKLALGDEIQYQGKGIGQLVNAGFSHTRKDYIGLALLDTAYACSGIDAYQTSALIPVRTVSPPVINNRSMHVSPQLHSYGPEINSSSPLAHRVTKMPSFAGQTVLVTGASRGLGRDIATAFANRGAHVYLGFHSRGEEAAATLAAIKAGGGSADLLPFDIKDSKACQQAIAKITTERECIDVLVNNAGLAHDNLAVMMSPEQWQAVVGTNLTGTFNCCQAVIRPMMARRQGSIVNICSVAGLHASPGQVNYAAAKGGMLALTTTLAAELAGYGIRVNAVVPGLLSTGMAARLDHRLLTQKCETIALKRVGKPEEVSQVVLFLASEQASYIVGQAIVVDGGLTL